MTLEKCANFRDFITRRWLRLFPAMLICSVIVFLSAPLFSERPAGPVVFRDLLPGLTFIEPWWWEKILRSHQGLLESAFWSLFVEVKFYVIFGFLYFHVGWKNAAKILFGLFVASAIFSTLKIRAPGIELHYFRWVGYMTTQIDAKYFGWFTAGILFYRYYAKRDFSLWVYATAMALASACTIQGKGPYLVNAAVVVAMIFSLSTLSTTLQQCLSVSFFRFIGFISYPLYLLHENMMVALSIKLSRIVNGSLSILIPLPAMAAVIGLGWVVAAFAEPGIRNIIRPPYERFRALIRATPDN
jgi:peptidoglycan/LPS O-acetylase OafA/YrhL